MVHKIDGNGATAQNEFTEGDPILGIPYTWLTDDWCNMVQRELVNLVEAAGLTPTKGNDGQLLSAIELLGGGMTGNAVWNANFDVWQRYPGGSPTLTAASYVADRWISQPGDGGSIVVRPVTLTEGDLFGQANRFHGELPATVFRHEQTVASTVGNTVPHLEQKIFDVRTLAGSEIVVSFFARSDTAITITPKFNQYFGAGAGASPGVLTSGTAINIPGTGVPAMYQQTITLPSISGKTIDLGVAFESYLDFFLEFSDGTTFELDLWNVRAETGLIPRPNVWVPPDVELNRCLSLFEKSYRTSVTPFSGVLSTFGASNTRMDVVNPGGQLYGLERRYMVPKRYGSALLVQPTWYFGTLEATARDKVGVDGVPVAITGQADATDQTTGYPLASSVAAGEHHLRAHWVLDGDIPI